MAVRFVDDLESASFEDTGVLQATGQGRNLGPVDEEGVPIMSEQAREAEKFSRFSARDAARAASDAPIPGFVVNMSGYSPYESIEELIDPTGVVEAQSDQWGLLTRLMHVADANGPLELFEKTNPLHFKLDVGEVVTGMGADMPEGIGEVAKKPFKTTLPTLGYSTGKDNIVLVDPMTKEIISTVPKLRETGEPLLVRGKPVFQVNDHWFELNIKFSWRQTTDKSAVAEAF